ncbi:hypothetical protein ASF66_16325 [Pseudomonas sp. Leaf129]|uniref:hypothetical protein n=1 Tax=Pseudomonas sp. Leaf129 TaxID=1736268 RepID=UPI000702B8C5|nr:hypothetical protein [Pseudomonas sp. Leaf129]KQQ59472.1 hypothetical protein ASF66_16325 [Pseudomonas sp. Leaf129]
MAGTTALAMGEDFKTGALAGGATEAMVSYLADRVMPEGYEPGKGSAEQAKANLLAMSNVVGLLSSVVTGGDPQVAADIAATATQYNHLSHSDLTRAANELNACAAKDGGCSEDVLQKFVRLSREQEIAAFQSCATNPDSCATTSSMVANAQARAEQSRAEQSSSKTSQQRLWPPMLSMSLRFCWPRTMKFKTHWHRSQRAPRSIRLCRSCKTG